MNCSLCTVGILEGRLLEKWLRRGHRWLLVRNVPALVCGHCGETLYSRETTARLVSLADPTNKERPTGFVTALEFDLQRPDPAITSGVHP